MSHSVAHRWPPEVVPGPGLVEQSRHPTPAQVVRPSGRSVPTIGALIDTSWLVDATRGHLGAVCAGLQAL
eukprot:1120300-Pyramimonas_sp.AAC.1